MFEFICLVCKVERFSKVGDFDYCDIGIDCELLKFDLSLGKILSCVMFEVFEVVIKLVDLLRGDVFCCEDEVEF